MVVHLWWTGVLFRCKQWFWAQQSLSNVSCSQSSHSWYKWPHTFSRLVLGQGSYRSWSHTLDWGGSEPVCPQQEVQRHRHRPYGPVNLMSSWYTAQDDTGCCRKSRSYADVIGRCKALCTMQQSSFGVVCLAWPGPPSEFWMPSHIY